MNKDDINELYAVKVEFTITHEDYEKIEETMNKIRNIIADHNEQRDIKIH